MILLDTSVLVSYYNYADDNHEKAKSIMNKLIAEKEELFISDYIFDELTTVMLSRLKSIEISVKAAEDILNFTNLIFIDYDLFQNSWEIFKGQKKTKLSFTDCSSIALMEKEGIKDIITFDNELKEKTEKRQ